MKTLEQHFGIKDLVAKWKVSSGFIRKLIRDGKLRTSDLNEKLVRISLSEINRFRGKCLDYLEELFTIEELVDSWKVSKSYIHKKIRNGELDVEHLRGRIVRISESSIREFKSKNKSWRRF